ncbi:MAG: MBL fold metallo-hydrolase [Thermodesulfobacteriota bacterium]|nr:MBL fold metallo-hydrolase [Thermodesulfobacteriota bacterium]
MISGSYEPQGRRVIKNQFGPIRVIPGEDRSGFPYCTSLFLDDDIKVLIDPGAGYQRLSKLKKEVNVDIVINTHYHYDHISYNHLFDDSQILINEKEAGCFRDRKILGSFLGMEEVYGKAWVDEWLKRIADPNTRQSPFSPQNNHNWWCSTARVDGEYKWGDVMDFGKIKMHILGAPGHSGGFSCMFFPDYGVIYVADLDLTAFGPWYGGSDGDIDLFIESCRKIERIDAQFFITGHEVGIVSKKEFQEGLNTFLDTIEKRDATLISLLSKPLTLEELVDYGVIYGHKYHVDAWVYMWNYIMTKKHLYRLKKQRRVSMIGDKFITIRK